MSIESVMLSNHPILCCSQYIPASGSFPMSQIFVSEGQIIGASASVLPMNIQGWFPLGLSGLMSLQPKGLSRVFSSTTIQKHQFFGCSAFIMWTQPLLWSHPYMTTGKTIAWTILTFVSTLMSLIFNTLSRFVIVFLLRNKHLLISWLLSTICRDFGAPKNKVSYCFCYFPIYLPWSDGTRCHDFSFLNVEN